MEQAERERIKSIAPGQYAALGSGPKASQYAKTSASNEVLTDACLLFGITLYRLAFLLGCHQPTKVYQWMGGECRPSVKYMVRLCRLHQMALSGLQLIIVRAINWDEGVIHYKPVWNGRAFVAETSALRGRSRDVLSEFMEKTPPWT